MPQLIYLLPTIFWMWMIWECVRYDPESRTWLWLLIFLNVPGAVIYFFARKLPTMRIDLPAPRFLQRRLRQKELWKAEADVLNIGNAYQYRVLGDLRLDLGLLEEAQDAYQQALEKEPNNLKALWGIVQIERSNNNLTNIKEYLQKILAIKPDYEYGEGSLLYIKTVLELEELDTAKILLEENIKHWNKPEARLLLAEIYMHEESKEAAKEQLQRILFSIRSSTKFHYKRNRHIEKKATKLLKII